MSITVPPVPASPLGVEADLTDVAPSEPLHDPLSPGVAALIGVAALALSVVCTTLLLTFSATTIDPLTAPALLSVVL